jgi:hypothetical protein
LPCLGGGGGCTQEQEPNNTEGTGTSLTPPTQAGGTASGCGTLSNVNDLDHFAVVLSAGTYRIVVSQFPAGTGLFLHVGTNQPSNPAIGQPVTFTVPSNGTNAVIGFYGSSGTYQFTLTKVQ